MGKKVKMVAKTAKKNSEQRNMTDEELMELSDSLVVAINNNYSSLKQVFGQDVLISLSVAVTVFFMHQAELTTAETGKDKKLLFEAIIEDFIKRLNMYKKDLLEAGSWPE